MSPRRSGLCLAVALATGLLPAACGDDGSSTSGPFCQSGPAVDEALNAEPPDPPRVEAALTKAEADAPEEISQSVRTAAAAVREAMATQDFAALEQPAVSEAVTELNEYYAKDCGSEKLDITGRDYKFEGMPQSVKPGHAVVELRNEGAELHEAVVMRINEGVTESVDQLLALDEEEVMSKVSNVGAVFANPNDDGNGVVNLATPGRYVVICLIPEGLTPEKAEEAERTGAEPEGQPHAALGMFQEFTVK